jgi:2-polyprenyl-3-methyl-5-hydroxy-6-metoxy-1,4-benzoquinol methylase
MKVYHSRFDPSDLKTSAAQIIRLSGGSKRVLEVGCACGYITRHLKDRNHRVTAIEINEEAATLAKPFCDRIIVADVERDDVLAQINGKFDVIILGDILEHLIEPQEVLNACRDKLEEDGCVILSVPNVAYWKQRIRLLFSSFDYTDEGILDKSHLRFFTLRSAKEMIDKCGFSIEYAGTTSTHMPKVLTELLPSLLAYQFVFKLTPK